MQDTLTHHQTFEDSQELSGEGEAPVRDVRRAVKTSAVEYAARIIDEMFPEDVVQEIVDEESENTRIANFGGAAVQADIRETGGALDVAA